VPAASAPKRAVLPPVISASDEPMTSEMAEVTEAAVVARTAKDPEHKTAEQAGVRPASGGKLARDASLWRRKQICGKRNAGENVAAQPAPIISAQPGESGIQRRRGMD